MTGRVWTTFNSLGNDAMCCFSQPVEIVSDTNIFARSSNGRQFLVYSMTYAASSQLAMVLPLPVPPKPHEDAVRFINLERYPRFFDDMRRGFPPRMIYPRSRGSRAVALDVPKLKVHDVGSYEASFVPSLAEFERLDDRFRIPNDVWDRLPEYRAYGFAVFKLKDTVARGLRGLLRGLFTDQPRPQGVHPMAFEFPRRNPDLLYFPTLHIHDRQVHPVATFDHMLYCQPDAEMGEYLQRWEQSTGPAAEFMDVARTEGIVDASRDCWRRPLVGQLQNKDALVGRGGTIPEYATA